MIEKNQMGKYGQSRDSGNIGHKTLNENIQN